METTKAARLVNAASDCSCDANTRFSSLGASSASRKCSWGYTTLLALLLKLQVSLITQLRLKTNCAYC